MIKNLNFTFLSFLLLSIFLSYCTPYSSNSSPINLGPHVGPDPGKPDPGEPDPGEPDPGEPDPEPEDPNPDPDSTTWKNISQIEGQSSIYKTLKGKSSYLASNRPEGASAGSLTQTVQALSDGSNYNTLELSYKVLGSYFSFDMELAVAESNLSKIYLTKDTKVFIYIVDSSMGVVAQPSTASSYSYFSVLGNRYSIGGLLQNFNDDFAKQYEGQQLAALMVYKAGKETYYIKYPFKYTIVKEPDPDPEPEPEPEVDLDGAINIKEWLDITSVYGYSTAYSTISSGGYLAVSYTAPGTSKSETVKALSTGKGFNILSVTASGNYFALQMQFQLSYGALPTDPGLSGDGYLLVLVNTDGDILEKSSSKLTYEQVTSKVKQVNITNLLTLKKTDYIGKNLSLVLAYKSKDKKVYYVKYPIYMR